MLYAIRNIRFFIVAALCLNSVMMKASEPRRYPVPKHHKSSSKGSVLSPLMFLGTLPGMFSHIHVLDFSHATQIVHQHKMMFGIATSILFLTLLVKQLQRSQMGTWCSEQCVEISSSVDNYTNDYIKEWPFPVQMGIASIKGMIQFFCNIIKRYIAMNKTTIVISAASPVAGRLLDCVCGCPIPLLNFTRIGWMVTGGVCIKGYYDSHFEHIDEKLEQVDGKLNDIETKIDESNKNNIQQHETTQQKIGVVQRAMTTVTDYMSTLYSEIKKLKTVVRDEFGNVYQKLTGMEQQINLLQNTLDANGTKSVEQNEDLKAQLRQLQKSYDEVIILLREEAKSNKVLKRELEGFKDIYQNNHEDLQKKLGLTVTCLSNQIDGVKKEVQEGFAAQNIYLGKPDHRDVQIKMLQLQVNRTNANNS